MRTLHFILISIMLLFTIQLNAQKTKLQEVKRVCEGLSPAEKPIVAVMQFKMAAPGADQAVGTGLPDMLMNALLNSGCFRVVERERLNDIVQEQGLGLSGVGDESTFASVGKIAGAQVLVMGSITEFSENESGGGGGGGGVLRGLKNKLGVAGASVGAKTSHIGFILKFVNPSTGELLDTKSFNKKKTSFGLAGGGGNGSGGGGGGFYKTKSMQDAVEEALIEATEYMSQNKAAYAGVTGNAQNNNAVAANNPNRNDCALLKLTNKPSMMVIVPEEHIGGKGSNYDPYRGNNLFLYLNSTKENSMGAYVSTIPCQASETEISRKLTEFGLRLKDPGQLEKLKNDEAFQNAFSNASSASRLGSRFGVDIMIVGDAFSEYSKSANGMVSCRATISIRAFMTRDASIIATQNYTGSGLDVSEEIAGKKALSNASSKIGDYLLSQFCLKGDDIASVMGNAAKSKGAADLTETEIQFNNIDFNKSGAIAKAMQAIKGVSNVNRISFADNIAKFSVLHTGDSNTLLDKIVNNTAGIKLDVKSVVDNTAVIDVK